MANAPIPSLPVAVTLDGTEQLEIVQPPGSDGTTKRTTIGAIAALSFSSTNLDTILGSTPNLFAVRGVSVWGQRAIVGSDLPNPSTATLGGVFSLPVTANEVLSGISNTGTPTRATTTGAGDVVRAVSPTISGTLTVTSTSASAFAVGRLGATNPAFNVDCSAGTIVNGFSARGAVTLGVPTLVAAGSDTNISYGFSSKGSASVLFYTQNVGSLGMQLLDSGGVNNRWFVVNGGTGGGNVTIGATTGSLAISSPLSLSTPLSVGNGGSGTSTTFTQGSVVFAGASGIYSSNTGFFWDNTSGQLVLNLATGPPYVAETNTQFQLSGANGFATTIFIDAFGATAAIDFRNSSGTYAARVATISGATMGQINWQGYDGTAYAKSARVRGQASENWNTTSHGTDLLFFATAAGTTSNSQKAKLGGSGDFSVNTSVTVPMLIGGTATSSTLVLLPTSGAGTTGADIIFQVGSAGATEAMRITTSGPGFVGVGTNAPQSKFHINGNAVGTTAAASSTLAQVSGADATQAHLELDGYGSYMDLLFRRANGTAGGLTQVVNNDPLGGFNARGYDGSAYGTSNVASFFILAEGNFTSTSQPTYMGFYTTTTGSVSAAERMRINSTGQISARSTTDATSTSDGPLLSLGGASIAKALFAGSINVPVDRALKFTNQTTSAGASAGTLTNAPAVGNPGFWLRVLINGTSYAIPCWVG